LLPFVATKSNVKVERSFDNVACCFDIVAGVDGALGVGWRDTHKKISGMS